MTITRDAWGIPRVTGSSVLDVAHEQGRATAQDRAWQLEVERRRVEGTTAELFGETAVEWDTLARRALLAELARQAHAGLSGSTRAFVEAYVEGVNAELGPSGRWQPWTPIGVFAVQHLLFSGFPGALWRRHLARTAGEEWVDLFRVEGLPGGSNAFAVAGELTASGLPIVAGDPHRLIEAPGCYAQVRLACTDTDDSFDVSGLTFPGVPGIQHFGHAGAVAWGITNAVAADEDAYVEELVRRDGDVLAAGPTGLEPVRSGWETIRVRGGDGELREEPVEVLVTGRGPVILGGPDRPESISLRTPAYVLRDFGFEALLPLLRARTTSDVTAAFDAWVGPVNNLVVADVDGQVEHRVVGRVPQRATGRPPGGLPGRGRDGHGWTGWVGDLPRRAGPVLVTANDRAAAAWGVVGEDFAPPHRARRIAALIAGLRAVGPLTPAGLAQVLADVRQTQGAALLDAVAALDPARLPDGARAARERLLVWDREMTADSVDAALFAALRAAVVDRLAAAPSLAGVDRSPYGDLFAPWFDLRARLRSVLPTLLARTEVFGLVVADVVAEALAAVPASPPAPWGTGHVALPLTPHEQFGLPAPAEVGREQPVLALPGDDDCVFAARALGGTGACVHGPVARYVWDLAGELGWVVPTGASGDPSSPHYRDQHPTWAAGGVAWSSHRTEEDTR